MAAVRPFTKYAGRAACARDIAPALTAAVKATVTGRPGAAYVDLPSDVLMAAVPPGELPAARAEGPDHGDAPVGFPAVAERQHADTEAVAAAAALLRGAQRSVQPTRRTIGSAWEYKCITYCDWWRTAKSNDYLL